MLPFAFRVAAPCGQCVHHPMPPTLRTRETSILWGGGALLCGVSTPLWGEHSSMGRGSTSLWGGGALLCGGSTLLWGRRAVYGGRGALWGRQVHLHREGSTLWGTGLHLFSPGPRVVTVRLKIPGKTLKSLMHRGRWKTVQREPQTKTAGIH